MVPIQPFDAMASTYTHIYRNRVTCCMRYQVHFHTLDSIVHAMMRLRSGKKLGYNFSLVRHCSGGTRTLRSSKKKHRW